ncbi:MAG: glycosyltransferase family 2 protein, partial [Planctomycetota bacterium]
MSTSAPRVSIVMIVLNGERFLEDALRSVVAQTTDDWEIVIVDDGSTDGTAAIAGRYVSEDGDRFRLAHHEGHVNRGMSASRNLGIRLGRGDYVTFLDHDDAMLPGKLEAQAGLLDAHPEVGAVTGP